MGITCEEIERKGLASLRSHGSQRAELWDLSSEVLATQPVSVDTLNAVRDHVRWVAFWEHRGPVA